MNTLKVSTYFTRKTIILIKQTAGGGQVELIDGGVVLPVVVQPFVVHQTRLDGLNLVDLLALQVILQEVDAVAHNQWNVHAVVAAGPLGGQADGHPKHGISEGQHLLRGGGLVLLLRQLLALLVLFVLLVGLFVFLLVLALVLLVLLFRLVAFLVFVLLAVLGLAGRAGLIVRVLGISFGLVAGLLALLLALGASKLECLGLL